MELAEPAFQTALKWYLNGKEDPRRACRKRDRTGVYSTILR
jgi:hypothetical protein